MTASHPFETAGLGKAPFRYVGMVKQSIDSEGRRHVGQMDGYEVTTKPGGTCAYCGTYILNMFSVRSADGQTFHVGSDCIEKAGGARLRAVVAEEVAKLRRQQAKVRGASKMSDAVAFLSREDVKAFMTSRPSLTEWRAAEGDTLADYAEFVWSRSGAAGRLRLAKAIRQAFESAAPASEVS